MTNLFTNINYSGLQTIFTDAITSMLDSTACTVPCTVEYGGTKWEDCSNCVYDPIGGKSSNVFQEGGPIPFSFGGLCPVCRGQGKREVISTENLELIVVYDPKQFINYDTTVNNTDGLIQTMGKINVLPALQRARKLITSIDIGNYFSRKYERITEPTPCGFGNAPFVVCTWKRI